MGINRKDLDFNSNKGEFNNYIDQKHNLEFLS
jgi:hypothetical protein